jgi:hypothetical protein
LLGLLFNPVDAGCPSEMSVDCYSTAWHYIPEDSPLYSHCCENLKSNIHNDMKVKVLGKNKLLNNMFIQIKASEVQLHL